MTNNIRQVVIIGASAAGLRAACRASRLLKNTKITVFDKAQHISLSGCGLPYYLAGDIENAVSLLQTPFKVRRDPEFFASVKGVEVRNKTLVEKIFTDKKQIQIRALNSENSELIPFDQLVLASGSYPRIPEIPGINGAGISTFKTLEEAQALKKLLESGQLAKVAIIGAGAIGCELAEAFTTLWGAEVTMLEAREQILSEILDLDMAAIVQKHLDEKGVHLHLNCEIKRIEDRNGLKILQTCDGNCIEVQRVVIAAGMQPDVKLAKEAGLEIGTSSGIVVDERLKTSDPNIYAAGDCIELQHLISERSTLLPLGSYANRQGWIVGSNLAGMNKNFGKVIGAMAVKVCDLNIACAGLTEKAAAESNLEAHAAWGSFTDVAEFYPEAKAIFLKVIYNPSNHRLLGLQAVGKGEVAKRCDVFATLLHRKGTLEDLVDLELAYAPPYAPALDALHFLGMLALNQEEEQIFGLSPAGTYSNWLGTILDIRMPEEVKADPLQAPKLIHIPLTEIRNRLAEISKKERILVVCSKGARSCEVARMMGKEGYKKAAYLGGGLQMKTGGSKTSNGSTTANRSLNE